MSKVYAVFQNINDNLVLSTKNSLYFRIHNNFSFDLSQTYSIEEKILVTILLTKIQNYNNLLVFVRVPWIGCLV